MRRPSPERPLEQLPTLKLKLSVVILAAVAVTVIVFFFGLKIGLWASVSGVAAGTVALVVVWFLARGITSPLREMAQATDAMARGDFSRRVTASSRDEIGALARSFNAMASELAETDRLRRDLVANVSHELRTPITALQVVLENLVDGVEPPDPETLRTMLAQVERLGRLVKQLLDLSRLEAGVVPLDRQPFDLEVLLDQAVRESRLSAPGVTMTVHVEPPDLELEADQERLHQVVANLVENAVRHSPTGGTIAVSACRRADRVAIEVSDEGPGIPDDEVARVFERFYRHDTARSSRDGGAGLGLAIAKWIVDLHGGDIRPERREPHGCRMVVTLPASPTPSARPATRTVAAALPASRGTSWP